tara:strand:+ start:7342 stop:9147 length:1806 start_codon:yes stop_codon:yes gene_type:complete
MSTVIKLKYSNLTAQPADDLLQISEPAYSYTNGGRLFLGADDSGTIVPHAIGGKYFTDKLDHTPGTLTANSAIIVDANSKIDVLNIDNITIDGNIISSTNADGDINIDPNGLGVINLQGPVTVESTSNFVISDLTATRVLFVGASSEITDNSNFTFDSSTNTLSISGIATVDNLKLDGNTLSSTDSNGNVVITANGTGKIDLGNNQTGLTVPKGVAGTRPTAAALGDGSIRYNETTGRFEGTVSGAWTGLGGVVDVDQDTYITAEEGSDDDTIRVYTAGSEVLTANTTVVAAAVEGRFPKIVVDHTGDSNNAIIIDNNIISINGSTIEGTGNSTLGTIVLDPAPAAGDAGGDLIVRGNLQVTGTTTTVNSTVVEIADPILVLGEDTAVDALDRGISAKYNDGSAKTAFFGWDRSSENAFTFIDDGSVADARFQNLKLEGSIVEVDGAAPIAGQLLIGHGTNGDMELATLTQGDSLTITNTDGGIELDVDPASTNATVDPFSELVTAGSFETGVEYTIVSVNDGVGGASTDFTNIGSSDSSIGTVFTATGAGAGTGTARSTGTNYASSGDNTANRGAASFASEQFTVTSGHVVLTTIDGGTF